jgi:8-oxo-dGTP pyrophosphatase MutT (NUDIX family)
MAAPMPPETEDRSERIARCTLGVAQERWSFAEQSRAEIAAHWQRALAQRPKLFDGTVFMLCAWGLEDETFCGTFVQTDFKSFLYWREGGYADTSVRDGFGSAVIRSAEGHVLLGRQTSGNLNAGFVYPPGGFIDARDVAGGAIDIEGSIARELVEETGLDPASLTRVPGYLLTRAGPLVSIGIEWRSLLPAVALRERILAHVRRESVPELADIVIVRSADEIDEDMMPRYARALLRQLLTA